MAVVARQLGLIWSAMTDEEKLPFQQQAAIERERVAAATEAWKQQQQELTGKDMSELLGQGDATDAAAAAAQTLIYPVARIRKICKLDPEVRGLSKEALLLIVKSAELVTAKLSLECVQMATIQNRRKLLPDDVAQVCATREQFAFLREDIVDLTRAQQKDAAAAAAAASSKTVGGGAAPATGTSKRSIAASKTKPLTDFFKPASS